MHAKIGLRMMAVSLISAALLMSGCSGDDGLPGRAGADGANGPAGPAGPAGPVTLTNQSCVVCHDASDAADQVAMHNFIYNAATDTRRMKTRYNETALAISNVTVASTAAGAPSITFTVKNGSTALTNVVANDVRAYIGTIVPAGTVTDRGTFGSAHIETWGYARNTGSATDNFASFTNNGSGSYTAVLKNPFGTASVSGSNTYRNQNFNAALPQRVYLRVTPTTTSLGAAVVNVNDGAGIVDFTIPAPDTTATPLDAPQNVIVTIEACRKCHGEPLVAAAHGGGYRDTLACVMCHSPLHYHAEAAEIDFTKFIHEIHAAKPVAAFPTRIFGNGYTDVTYPRPLSDCNACHTASGRTLLSGNKVDNWKDNPSIEACSSCHEDFTTVQTFHVGMTNSACKSCHTATAIATKHTPAVATKDVPEYKAALAITPPANGTHYVAGESPTVTVTLKDYATDAAVPAALYTSAKHAAGSTVANSLSTARLYVYGPRANAKPVLTKAAVTLSAAGIPTQRQDLFVNAADPQILTDGTGFKYKLTAIPAGFTAGTYMVRFTGQNYGYVSDSNYKIDTTAFQNIQIGTATVEAKIAGNSTTNCTDCHGNGLLEIHNARHSVVFNTDECISCHDKSGNHADPLDNRVHAIHSASKTGDALDLDWSAVTYPQGLRSATIGATAGAPRCIGCHTNTAATAPWKTSISQNSCIACHADKKGVVDHLLQNGGAPAAAH